MKRSIAVLKTYFQTGNKPTQQQFSDFLDSFFHKDAGVIITNISNTEELITLTYSNGSTSEIPITALPSSVDPDFVNGLELFMETVTDFMTGNTKTDNNFTDQNLSDLTELVEFLEAYVTPSFTINGKSVSAGGSINLLTEDISDVGCANKWVSAAEKTYWNNKQNATNKRQYYALVTYDATNPTIGIISEDKNEFGIITAEFDDTVAELRLLSDGLFTGNVYCECRAFLDVVNQDPETVKMRKISDNNVTLTFIDSSWALNPASFINYPILVKLTKFV